MLRPLTSCTAGVPLLEDKHVTEDEAREVPVFCPARYAS